MGRSRTNHQGGGLRETQDKFVRLIAQDVLNSEACRIVGIHRRTVTRWRLGRTILNMAGESVHYPPVASVDVVGAADCMARRAAVAWSQ